MTARAYAEKYTEEELKALIEITKSNAYALADAAESGMKQYRGRALESLGVLANLREALEMSS